MPTTTTTDVPAAAHVRRRRSSAEERREQVLAAAVSEFAARGLEGTRTEDVARRAGISQAYVFRLFGSKRELFLATVERVFDRIEETFVRAVAESDEREPDALLAAMGRAYANLLEDRELLLAQMQTYAAASDREIREVVQRRFAALWSRLARESGATPADMQTFFARGMLMNVAAALDLPRMCGAEGWDPDMRPGAAS